MNTNNWEEFNLKDLFKIEAGQYHYPSEYDKGSTPYCSASNSNNGISDYINLKPEFKANKIITGKVGCTAFYESEDFCATSDCNILTPLFNMNRNIALFIVTIINYDQNYRWNYGRQCRVGNMRKMSIKLPAKIDHTPDWQFMDDYIKKLHSKRLTTHVPQIQFEYGNKFKQTKDFKLGDIIQISNGKNITKQEIAENPGKLPAVQSGEINNGVLGYISEKYCRELNYTYTTDLCMTVARTGSSGFVAIQKNGCVVGDSAKIMIAKDKAARNIWIYIFITTLLNSNRYKYVYGRKVVTDKYLDTILNLPVDNSGEPDWKNIIKFVKEMPYSDKL